MHEEEMHPYVRELHDSLVTRERGYIQIKLKTLLNRFGYQKRTERNIQEIQKYLSHGGVKAVFSLSYPSTIHDRIKITMSDEYAKKNSSVNKQNKSEIETNNCPSSTKDSICNALDATVLIITETGIGSGFIVHNNGVVITCRHVIEYERATQMYAKIVLHPNHPDAIECPAKVIKSHRSLDYAILYLLEKDSFPTIQIGDAKSIQYTDEVFAIGSPKGIPNTVSKGIISNPVSNYNNIEYIQTDAGISPGFSGGPLVNNSGAVLGINQGGFPDHPATNFCIPIDYLTHDIQEITSFSKDNVLNGYYCPFCGFFSLDHPEWYCNNCGTQKIIKVDTE